MRKRNWELERNTNQAELNTIATYYFDGQGKALRPMVAILMARAVNYHVYGENSFHSDAIRHLTVGPEGQCCALYIECVCVREYELILNRITICVRCAVALYRL
ncbi:Decaprenyl-diphosphate synthase subunit 1 [Eumeta japonica]|uniref:Decaprenyl-diphosphate synthase subunit 1 n=1 Tax=Eumeta variegata TaxID=151549 RepID=A0A4C1Z5L1_EUMVA|nr:Decaprenyl-diphosphate synthase subunit 1 [Eumeta japonica]